jgi:NADH:ubiquinone oxidoreductase subunit 6 (subunit J)
MSIRELVSLIILLVYVGAISVLFLYVRAVSPNSPPLPSSTLKLLGLIIIFGYSVSSLLSSSTLVDLMSCNLSTSDEMFSGLGIILITCLVFILIVVLAATTFISPLSSTFRRINMVSKA